MQKERKARESRRQSNARWRGNEHERQQAAGHIAAGMASMLQLATEPVWQELTELSARVRELERAIAAMHVQARTANPLGAAPRRRGRPPGSSRFATTAARSEANRRIRWGSSDEEIRQTVLAEAARIRERTGKLDVATLRAELPSVFRFLYGDRAVFAGVKGLAAELGS